jgi:aspartate/methionine/tyrosine aminotransferase
MLQFAMATWLEQGHHKEFMSARDARIRANRAHLSTLSAELGLAIGDGYRPECTPYMLIGVPDSCLARPDDFRKELFMDTGVLTAGLPSGYPWLRWFLNVPEEDFLLACQRFRDFTGRHRLR